MRSKVKAARWWQSRRSRRLAVRRAQRFVRVILIVVGTAAGVSAIGAAYAAPALLRAQREGRTLLLQGRDAILRNDLNTARERFTRATAVFGAAENKLRTPLLWPVRAVPIASTNLVVARQIASIGRQIAGAGFSLASSVQRLPGGTLRVRHGVIPLDTVASAADALDAGAAAATDINDEVDSMPTGWVVPQLARLRTEIRALTPAAAGTVMKAQVALRGMPNMLGAAKPKRYLVAFSNLSELRGSGGLFGYVTALDAFHGHLKLENFQGFPVDLLGQPGKTLSYPAWFPDDFRTQAELLQNINLTTDFPTAAGLFLQAAGHKGGAFNGVISVDPDGIAAVLAVTGPIHVPLWPSPLAASNVAQVMQHDVYSKIPNREQRDAFFAAVVRMAFERLTASDVAFKPKAVGAFDGAVQAGHFRMFSTDPSDESWFRVIGLAGNVDRASGASDALSVVCENSSGNKMDWFLSKKIRYSVLLDPRRGVAHAFLDVDVANASPSSGLPDYVIGGKVPGVSRGTNRSTLMLVRSGRDQLVRFAVAGNDRGVLGTAESELRSYRTGLLVPSGGHVHVDVASVVGAAFLGPKRTPTYQLRLLPQAVAHADTYEVTFQAAKGWHVVGPAHVSGALTSDVVLNVHLAQTRRGLFVRILTEPFRLFRRLF